MNMKGDVLVLGEIRDNEIDDITFQMLGKGREIADERGARLLILLLGYGIDKLASSVLNAGVDEVLVADHPILKYYNSEAYLSVIENVIKEIEPSLFLLGYTYIGMEIAPSLSIRLKVPLATNCVDVKTSEGGILAIRSIYGGKLNSKVKLEGPSPAIISIQRGALPRKTLKAKSAILTPFHVKLPERPICIEAIDVIQPVLEELDIKKADIIVSVGRGILAKENINMIEELANAMEGVVGCTRPLVDIGWLPHERQIGTSGKTVSPRIYIAIGISGSPQHTAGMRGSNKIIAINKDPNAPIFNIAHYGIIGDLFQVVPVLIKEIKRLKG